MVVRNTIASIKDLKGKTVAASASERRRISRSRGS